MSGRDFVGKTYGHSGYDSEKTAEFLCSSFDMYDALDYLFRQKMKGKDMNEVDWKKVYRAYRKAGIPFQGEVSQKP